AACDEIDLRNTPAVELIQEFGRIRQVADVAQPTKVRCMRFDGPRIEIGAEQDREPGFVEPEAESAGAAEEVDRGRPRSVTHPPSDLLEIAGIRCRRVCRQAEIYAAVVGDRGPARPTGCCC